MPDYKYLFFDVANTLIYKPLLAHGILETLKQYNIEIDASLLKRRHKLISEVISFPAETSQEFYDYFNAELLLALGVVPNSELVAAIFNRCSCLEWVKFDDTEILDRIPVPLGIISNWDSTLGEKLASLFRVSFFKIVVSTEVGYAKPDPAIFANTLSCLDCRPNEVLYVGDSIKLDFMPATIAGMTAVLIDRDEMYPNFNGKRIRSLNELTNYFPVRGTTGRSGET